MPRANFQIEWEANEYEHKERSQDWYWAVGIIAISVAVASVIFGNIVFGILILVSAFALSLYVNRVPEKTKVIVNERGITKNKVLYPYGSLESFWIDIDHPHKKILLRSRKIFMPLIVIPLADEVDPYRLERTLTNFIPEEFHVLPLVERLLEYLGF